MVFASLSEVCRAPSNWTYRYLAEFGISLVTRVLIFFSGRLFCVMAPCFQTSITVTFQVIFTTLLLLCKLWWMLPSSSSTPLKRYSKLSSIKWLGFLQYQFCYCTVNVYSIYFTLYFSSSPYCNFLFINICLYCNSF